jgi:hypothetical protein
MEDKVATVRAVGTGCLRLAKANMGLFLTAFVRSHQLIQATPKWPGADILAWSAVHGLTILVVFGQRLLDMVKKGCSPRKNSVVSYQYNSISRLAFVE